VTDPPSDFGDFIFGESPFGGVVSGATGSMGGPVTLRPVTGYAVAGALFPPFGPTTITKIVEAYLYVQYADDAEVTAFFDAYNTYAQAYLDWFNNLNLPVYTGANIAGPFLDWVATGLYGVERPALPAGAGAPAVGPPNTWAPNFIALNTARSGRSSTFTVTTDDTYKRVITWAFYKGDGKIFTPTWLKRRINRFLGGVNGTDVPNDETYAISVAPTGPRAWTITLGTTPAATIFKAAVEAGVLELPFQTAWTVTLT
jgi:hypothetical protein